MVVNHNMRAENTQRQYAVNEDAKEKSVEKLSSGYRINRSGDDAAGLMISEKMRQLIRGLGKGGNNIQDGVSLLEIADGALEEVHQILDRMGELAVQAANDICTDEEREALQEEADAMKKEITRIGKQTVFNGMHILDDYNGQVMRGRSTSITSIVSSPSASAGRLSEAIQVNNLWYPAATLDFSGVNASNISRLDGKGFAFYCSQSCQETFDIKFSMSGQQSGPTNPGSSREHKYVIDISNCQSGTDVVDAVYNYISANPARPNSSSGAAGMGGLVVSHSNNLLKNGNTLIVARNWGGLATEAAAKNAYANVGGNSGRIDASSLIGNSSPGLVNTFYIQCSSEPIDFEEIHTYQMNSSVLGVEGLSLLSHSNASEAIETVSGAIAQVSEQRSSMGAEQNRLEHTLYNNQNIKENSETAESKIRDTDMEEELVNYWQRNVLTKIGEAMLAQANASTQDVLSVLQ